MIIDRKTFLQKLGLLGLTGLGLSGYLASCSEAEKQESSSKPEGTVSKPSGPCTDYTGVSQMDLDKRRNLRYRTNSEEPEKSCAGCHFFTPGEGAEGCGKCAYFAGPVNPGGLCIAFVQSEKQAG